MRSILLSLIFLFTFQTISYASSDLFFDFEKSKKNVFSPPNNGQILFVFLNFSKQENALPDVQLKKIKRTKGKLKKDISSKITLRKNEFILCSFLDKSGNIVKQTQIENPLLTSFEMVNEKREFEKVQIAKEKASVCIRLQDDDRIVRVKLEWIDSTGKLKSLASIALR